MSFQNPEIEDFLLRVNALPANAWLVVLERHRAVSDKEWTRITQMLVNTAPAMLEALAPTPELERERRAAVQDHIARGDAIVDHIFDELGETSEVTRELLYHSVRVRMAAIRAREWWIDTKIGPRAAEVFSSLFDGLPIEGLPSPEPPVHVNQSSPAGLTRAPLLWCWRCRAAVPMLTPAEWDVMCAARDAGGQWADVLAEERSRLGGGPFTSPERMALVEMRGAWWCAGHECFTEVRETRQDVVLHHRLSLLEPPCSDCGKPLRTPYAKLCMACGKPRADTPPVRSSSGSRTRFHMSEGSSDSIAEALRLPDEAFLAGMGEATLPPRLRFAGKAHWPERLKMSALLASLYELTYLNGLSYCLPTITGSELLALNTWCRESGAMRTSEMLDSVQSLFTAAELADDELWQERVEALSNDTDELTRIDRAYCDAIIELPRRFRHFVREHQTEFTDAVATFEVATATRGIANFPGSVNEVAMLRALRTVQSDTESNRLSRWAEGTILEISHDGVRRYVQVMNAVSRGNDLGTIVRVLPGLHSTPCSVEDIMKGEANAIFLLVDMNATEPDYAIEEIGNRVPLAEDREAIAFRHWCGVDAEGVAWWGIWRGGADTDGRQSEPLSAELTGIPLLNILSMREFMQHLFAPER